MRVSSVKYLTCSSCRGTDLKVESFEAGVVADHLEAGRLVCNSCREWFKIEDGILDLLPLGLRNFDRYQKFAAKWRLDATTFGAVQAPVGEFKGQREQIDFFERDSKVYDDEVSELMFYRVVDALCFQKWTSKFAANSLVVDIGSGTGRLALPLAKRGDSVLCLDISEPMLRKGQKKIRENGVEGQIDLVIADANNLPLRDNMCQAAFCYGALHHVPDPATTIKEASRILHRGGMWFTLDPHRSPLRFIFDIAMKVQCLYEEEANEEPLLRVADMKRWCENAGIDAKIDLMAYVLPHFLNCLSYPSAFKFLKFTDSFFSHIPGVRLGAGLITVEGTKTH